MCVRERGSSTRHLRTIGFGVRRAPRSGLGRERQWRDPDDLRHSLGARWCASTRSHGMLDGDVQQ
jgi:hypothetical protein